MWKRLILPSIVAVILALALFSGLVFDLSFLPGSTGSKGGLSVKELERPATKPARRAGKILKGSQPRKKKLSQKQLDSGLRKP